jgi:long-chain acyl-CoA synthetase
MAWATIEDIRAAVEGQTAPRGFLELAAAHPDHDALHAEVDGESGHWHTWLWSEYRELVARAAAGLTEAGVRAGDRVLLMIRNRPDFHWFDTAAQFLRATPISIYNSSSPEQIHYLAHHAEAQVAIVEDTGFLDRLLKIRGGLPALQRIYVIEPGQSGVRPVGVHPASDLLDSGAADLDALAAATDPSDIATIIYTSGTTGPPKGVMLSQHNIAYMVEQLRRCTPFDSFMGKRSLSFLPMAHISQRLMCHYEGMMLGYSVYCCPDPNLLSGHLTQVRPEILFGSPRVWEKIQNAFNAVLASDSTGKAGFDDALAAALLIKQAEFDGTATRQQHDTWAALDAATFASIRARVGLDAVRVAITAAAPIPRPVLEWYRAIGVPLSESYGMTESTAAMTWSPWRNKPGYVGQALPGCEVAIADDGEVICRGGNVFQGYLKQPDKSAETIIDGWLHTGDIGELDSEGYLRIIDRKKELIITSGGKNVSPANLEAALKAVPLVGQAAVIGEGRPFVSAILALDPDMATVWARTHRREPASLPELAANSSVIAEVQAGVDQVNRQLADVEQIIRFTIVGEEWLPDSELLTPTSKLKRRSVYSRYAVEIEAMYTDVT